jgi:hypothetical protein
VDHWVFQDAYAFKAWNYILLCAAYREYSKPCKGRMVSLLPGQLIYGRPEWSRILNIPEGRLRNLIDLLEQDRMITLKTVGRRYSVISVVNWEQYQGNDESGTDRDNLPQNTTNETTNVETSNNAVLKDNSNQQDSQQKTNRQPNKKNIKNINNKYTAEFESFYLTYPRAEEKRRTFNNWQTCLKSYTEEQLITAAVNYKNKKVGVEMQFLKSSANFLGKEKPFEDYIKIEAAPAKAENRLKDKIISVPDFFIKANGY